MVFYCLTLVDKKRGSARVQTLRAGSATANGIPPWIDSSSNTRCRGNICFGVMNMTRYACSSFATRSKLLINLFNNKEGLVIVHLGGFHISSMESGYAAHS